MNASPELRNKLERWLEKVRGYRENPPPNESTTCYWVIDPLLEALGYEREDIEPQVGDVARQYPDYTIMPRSDSTWYIEAKQWKDSLDDLQASQALTYANNNGRRFVLLTNGRDWRLYDNDRRGTIREKLVARAELDDGDGLVQLLTALSKTAVTSRRLDAFADRFRIRSLLEEGLTDPKGEIVKAIGRALARTYPELGRLSTSELAECLSEILHPREPISLDTGRTGTGEEKVPDRPQVSSATLKDLAERRVDPTGRNLQSVRLPTGETLDIRTWRDLMLRVVEWADRQKPIPVPFRGQSRGKRLFINKSPVHEDGHGMRGYYQITLSTGTGYVDVFRSARDFARSLATLCESLGMDPSEIVVELS
ncbi:MAG: hypothetical protein AMXMBFR61_04690 [Fimbriimonadales bacterium]